MRQYMRENEFNQLVYMMCFHGTFHCENTWTGGVVISNYNMTVWILARKEIIFSLIQRVVATDIHI